MRFCVFLWLAVFWVSFVGGFWKHWLWYITVLIFFGPIATLVICAKVERMVKIKRLRRQN